MEREREDVADPRGGCSLVYCVAPLVGIGFTLDFTVRGGERYAFYRCRNAGVCERRPSIGANLAEAFVVPVLEERMLLHREADVTSSDEAERLRAELASPMKTSWSFAAVREGAVKAVEAAGTEAAVKERIEATQSALDEVESLSLILALSTTDTETMTSKRSRLEAFLNSIDTRILVAPGRGPERVWLDTAEASTPRPK